MAVQPAKKEFFFKIMILPLVHVPWTVPVDAMSLSLRMEVKMARLID
ncbi:hypothetical protein [Shinella sp.]